MRTLKHDFKTIADFRAANCRAFKSVFRQFTVLSNGSICLDASFWRLTARASRRSTTRTVISRGVSWRRSLRPPTSASMTISNGSTKATRRKRETSGARVENLAKKIEALREKPGRYGTMLADLERTGESQISLTDPDSRGMAAHTKVAVGYNVQVAVDAKNKMIVGQKVTNQVVDVGPLGCTKARFSCVVSTGPRRFQPDGARVQHAASAEYPRHREAYGGGRGIGSVLSQT